jgi:hypothetical protein
MLVSTAFLFYPLALIYRGNYNAGYHEGRKGTLTRSCHVFLDYAAQMQGK